jgi:hypothetical protein
VADVREGVGGGGVFGLGGGNPVKGWYNKIRPSQREREPVNAQTIAPPIRRQME